MKATRGEYTLSSDLADQQPERIHAYLSRSYWAEGISLELVKRSIAHSLCFGVFHHGVQVGCARVITDQATFAYLADVYVLEEHRRRGLAHWLVESVMAHPALQGLRRFTLATRDAYGLYAEFGFKAPTNPETIMEIRRPNVYRAAR